MKLALFALGMSALPVITFLLMRPRAGRLGKPDLAVLRDLLVQIAAALRKSGGDGVTAMKHVVSEEPGRSEYIFHFAMPEVGEELYVSEPNGKAYRVKFKRRGQTIFQGDVGRASEAGTKVADAIIALADRDRAAKAAAADSVLDTALETATCAS